MDKAQETAEQKLKSEFVSAFNALCEKHGFTINTQPIFIARDDGTFSVKLISNVVKLPKKE